MTYENDEVFHNLTFCVEDCQKVFPWESSAPLGIWPNVITLKESLGFDLILQKKGSDKFDVKIIISEHGKV